MAHYERPINISQVLPSTDRQYPFAVRWDEALGGPNTKPKRRRFNTERAAKRFRRKLVTLNKANRQGLQ